MAIIKTTKDIALEARATAEYAESAACLVRDSSDEDTQIEQLIRQRYSMSQELALHRKHAMGVLEAEEWDAYCTYVQGCIDEVRAGNAE